MKRTAPKKLAFNVAEAAAALGVSRWTISREIADGKLQASRIRGRVLVLASSIERLLAIGHKEMMS